MKIRFNYVDYRGSGSRNTSSRVFFVFCFVKYRVYPPINTLMFSISLVGIEIFILNNKGHSKTPLR